MEFFNFRVRTLMSFARAGQAILTTLEQGSGGAGREDRLP